jgi:hypothetical protein
MKANILRRNYFGEWAMADHLGETVGTSVKERSGRTDSDAETN